MAIVNLPFPYTLTPDTLADATQVMANFLWLAGQVNTGVGTLGTVKVTASSTLQSYLQAVLSPGSGITFTLRNPGGAEQLEISSSAASVQVAQMQAIAACI